jgi:sugar phosphate isomerase/epimerase
MQNRRDFIRKASMMLAGSAVAPQMLTLTSCGGGAKKASETATATDTAKNIGLQLYSLREMVKDDGIQAVLKTVAKMGYKNLETAGYDNGKVYGLAPAEFKKIVTDLGMKCTSAHLGQTYSKDKEAEVMSWWDQAVDAHNQLGVKYIIQPWMPVDDATTLDDLKMYCDYFTTVGYKTAAASIAFGYHNHSFEWRKIDGQLIFDFLLDNVSRNHVCFELDVYWCQVGGGNPVSYLKDRPGQFKAVHIKDEKEIGVSGRMDFKSIFDQMYANNIKDWYVEVEEYTNNDPVASVQQSFDYLNLADYVH